MTCCSGYVKVPGLKKLIRIMKITLFLILLSVGCVLAGKTYSQTKLLNLNVENATIKEILTEIEDQSEFYFMYSSKLIDVEREVSMNIKEQNIDKVLSSLFTGTDVNYVVKDRFIVLTNEGKDTEFTSVLQQKSISGTVTDETGQPLPGVTIVIKGTTTGTVTDINGKFNLSNVLDDAILQFSFVGMQTQEITVENRTTIDVIMRADAIGIEEVVAIGYGVKTKATLTGAVETVTEKQFASKPQTNIAQSLQGAVPGLLVTRGGGQVGVEDNGLQIRGRTSRAGTGVLVIIDGIPQPENNAQALNEINPNDVESISVLKDAQASIYGSRAAGGVILITTKSGKSGKPVIKYSGNFAINVPALWARKANIYDQADYYNRAFGNDGVTQHSYTYLKDLLPTLDRNNPQVIPGPFSDVPKMWSGYFDWMDIMFDPAFQQTHQVSVSGRSEKSNYYVSVGVLDQPGMIAFGSNYNKRYFSRFKYKFDIIDELSVSTNVSLERQKILEPSRYSNAVSLASAVWSTHFPRTPEGNYFNFGGFQNPIAFAEAGGEKESVAHRSSVQFTVNFRPVNGLEIVGDYAINADNNAGSYLNKIIQQHDYDENPTIITQPNSAGSNLYRNVHQVVNLYASYKYSIKDHHLGIMIGGAHEENDYKYFSAGRQKLVSEAVSVLTLGDPELQSTDEDRSQWALKSYFSRLNYDFKGRYLFEGTMRRDGSSRFASDYRWGNYFGASGAWIASEESFVKDLGFFDYLKIRLSYGELGNQNNVGLYDHISIIGIGGLMLFGNPDSPTRNLVASTSGVLASPTRTWETVAIQNLGVDFRLLNSKLNGSFDYFIKNTRDMLVTKEFPEVLGIAPSTVNGGEMRTKGWELSLGWNDKIKNEFKYFANFTLADDKSEITSLEDARVPGFGLNSFVEGQPFNSYYTLQYDGFIANDAELTEYKKIVGVPSNLRVGDARFKDMDGDGKIEYSEYRAGDSDSGDLINIGSSTIRFQYGLTVGFEWKGFDFSAFMQGVGKWNVMSGLKQPGSAWWETPLEFTIGKDWTEENPNSLYPKASTNGGIDGWNYQNSDAPYKWYNAKYMRLKNVQVGYSFSSQWVNKLKLDKVRVYFSGNDLWEKTNIPKGLDPEKPFSIGYTPFPRTYSFGIDVTL